MKRIVFIVLLSITAFQVSARAQNPDSTALREMVAFDKAFIPALVYTNSKVQDSSEIAMKYVLTAWNKFKADNEKPIGIDSQWNTDIKTVSHLLGEADTLIIKDSNLYEAHLKLENVRTIFVNMRELNDIEYYPDNLITFHALMEAMLNIVENTKPADLNQEQVEGISIILPQAMSTWHNVEQSKFDKKLFGFSDQKVDTLNQLINQEQLALSTLQSALDSNNNAEIIKDIKSIKPIFMKVYLLFGDFNMKRD